MVVPSTSGTDGAAGRAEGVGGRECGGEARRQNPARRRGPIAITLPFGRAATDAATYPSTRTTLAGKRSHTFCLTASVATFPFTATPTQRDGAVNQKTHYIGEADETVFRQIPPRTRSCPTLPKLFRTQPPITGNYEQLS